MDELDVAPAEIEAFELLVSARKKLRIIKDASGRTEYARRVAITITNLELVIGYYHTFIVHELE